MLAEQALESAHLDQVWMIPTGCSYLKTKEGITVLPGTERYDMVQRAIADNDRFRCLDIEIKRPGDSYSYETMEQLHREYPEHLFISSAGLTACLPWNMEMRRSPVCCLRDYSCGAGRCGYEGNAGEDQAVRGTFFCEDTVALFSKN